MRKQWRRVDFDLAMPALLVKRVELLHGHHLAVVEASPAQLPVAPAGDRLLVNEVDATTNRLLNLNNCQYISYT